MDFAKVVIHTSVMACNRHIAIPDAGVLKMPRPRSQGGGTRSLVDLDLQADGGDGQGGDITAAVIESVCHRRIGRYAAAGVHAGQGRHRGGIRDGGSPVTRRGAVSGAGVDLPVPDQIGRQQLTAAQNIGGRRAEGGRDQSSVFAAVSVGRRVGSHIDGVI